MKKTGLVSSGLWSLAISLVTGALGVLFAGMTIRYLGYERAGLANAISAILMMNALLGGLGLGTAAIHLLSSKELDQNPIKEKKIIGTLLSSSIITGAIGLFISIALGGNILNWCHYSNDLQEGKIFLFYSGLSFLMSQINSVGFNIFQGLRRFDIYAPINLASSLITSIGSLVALTYKPDLYTYGFWLATSSGLTTITIAYYSKKSLKINLYPTFCIFTFREMFNTSKWIYLSAIAGIAGSGLDRAVVSSISGISTLPIYTFSRKFLEMVHGLMVNQSGFLLPNLNSASGENQESEKKKLLFGCWVYFTGASIIYGAICIIAPVLAEIVVSKDFSNHIRNSSIIFSIIGVAQSLCIVPFQVAISRNKSLYNTLCQLAFLFIMLPAMYIGGKLYSYEGCVIGQLSIIPIVVMYLYAFCKKISPTPIKLSEMFSIIWKPLVSFSVMLLISKSLWITQATKITNILLTILFVLLASLAIFYSEYRSESKNHFGQMLKSLIAKMKRKYNPLQNS